MRWRLLLSVLAFCASLGAQALVLGAEDAAGPWGGADGSGCGNDIVKAAYRAVGIPAELKILPYARAKELVLKGSLVGCFAMGPSPDLKGEVIFSREPLYSPVSTFVRRRDRHQAVHALEDVPVGNTVGTVIDYEYPESMLRLFDRGVRNAPNSSESANLEMLSAGRLDLVVLQVDELKSLDFLLQEAKAKDVVVAFSLEKAGSYVGFSRRHPRGRWAKDQFDRGFALIKADGTLAGILNSWKARMK